MVHFLFEGYCIVKEQEKVVFINRSSQMISHFNDDRTTPLGCYVKCMTSIVKMKYCFINDRYLLLLLIVNI